MTTERSWKDMEQDAGTVPPDDYRQKRLIPTAPINHLAEAKYHLSQMSYGEFMEVIMGAISTSNHSASTMLQRVVARRLWSWVKK